MPWRIEARKHFWPFAFAAFANVSLGIAWLVLRSDTMLLLYSLTKMLVWFFVAGYCIYVLYSFYYLGSDVLMHLSPLPQRRVLLAKAAVLGAYLYVLFLIALPVDVVQLGDARHGNLLIVVMYYLGAKAISIVSYLSLCMVAVWLAKRFRNRVLSVAAMALTLGVVTIGLGVLLFALVSSPGWQWSIGVSDMPDSVNQYSSLLPITVASIDPRPLDATFSFGSFAPNVLLLLVSCIFWAFLVPRFKFDFYPR